MLALPISEDCSFSLTWLTMAYLSFSSLKRNFEKHPVTSVSQHPVWRTLFQKSVQWTSCWEIDQEVSVVWKVDPSNSLLAGMLSKNSLTWDILLASPGLGRARSLPPPHSSGCLGYRASPNPELFHCLSDGLFPQKVQRDNRSWEEPEREWRWLGLGAEKPVTRRAVMWHPHAPVASLWSLIFVSSIFGRKKSSPDFSEAPLMLFSSSSCQARCRPEMANSSQVTWLGPPWPPFTNSELGKDELQSKAIFMDATLRGQPSGETVT